MDEEPEFEKLYRKLEHCRYYSESIIAIANCPDNWSMCSFIISVYERHDGKNKFIGLHMDKEETISIRDALTKIIEDMPEEK